MDLTNLTNITTTMSSPVAQATSQDVISRVIEGVASSASWLGSTLSPTLGISPTASLVVTAFIAGMGAYALWFRSYEWTVVAVAIIAAIIIL